MLQEFMKMGLRGLTVIFSSGDDGIGNFLVRDDPDTACQQAYPAWVRYSYRYYDVAFILVR